MYTKDEIVELLETNLRLHTLLDGYESCLEKSMIDYVEIKNKVGELQTKVDKLTNENEKLKNENSLLSSLHKDKVNIKPEKKEYKFDCVNAFKIYQQAARDVADIMYNDLIPFNCIPMGAVYYTKGGAGPFIKLSNATDEPLHEQTPNSFDIDKQHYIVSGGKMLCRIKKRREDF